MARVNATQLVQCAAKLGSFVTPYAKAVFADMALAALKRGGETLVELAAEAATKKKLT
jgi:hypothetical protein